jgi:altronate dehydratase
MNLAGRVHVRVDARDNVTTVLDHCKDETRLAGGGRAAAGVPFGHKIALVPIAAGAAVIKYGVVIGHATREIDCGEHVHVHNCA